jgi:hypothetical protein
MDIKLCDKFLFGDTQENSILDTQENKCEPLKESNKISDENKYLLETWKLNIFF